MNRMMLLGGDHSPLRIVLWARGRDTVLMGSINPERSAVAWSTRRLAQPAHACLVADINGDGKSEFLYVGLTDSTLFLVPDVDADSFHASASIRLPLLPSGIVTIKRTSGPNSDILLFEHDTPGILPVLGAAERRPRFGRVIAPEMAVGALVSAQLNNDGIVDMIAYDWVRSELHFLYGVGNVRFLDQTVLPVSEGVSQLLAMEDETGETLDLVVVGSDSTTIQWWHGDGLGDFKPHASYKASAPVTMMRGRDLNDDQWPDVVSVSSRGTLQALLNSGSERVDEGPEIAVGADPCSFDFLTGDGSASVVLSGGGKKLFVIEDGRRKMLTDSLLFSAGLEPSSLLIGDLNNDSHPDIVSVSTAGKSLEFHLSDATGALGGAVVLHLNEESAWLGLHSISDTAARFIASSPKGGSVSFVTYYASDGSHSEALIPGVGALEPLSPVKYRDGRIGYYCYAAPGEAVTSSLSFFQQLGGNRFIERSFKLTIPDVLMGASVADIDHDGNMDAAFVYRDAASGRYELATAYGDSSGEFSRRGAAFLLPDTSLAKSYLYFTDVNKDSVLDLVTCFPKNARTIHLSLGQADGKFVDSRKVQDSIRIEDRTQLQILDVDSDGNVDIVVNDRYRGGVGYLKGNGTGDFEPWAALYRDDGISHFGFGDFNGDGTNDLVVALKREGVLKLVDGKRIFSR